MSNTSVFDSAVPNRLQRSLTKSVLENYRLSSRYCYRNFGAPQAKDLSGHYCRARIEEEMAGIAALFPMVTVAIEPYERNTGFYNEITCGQVKLTQSRILNPYIVPRDAKFRSTLAENGQGLLFPSADEHEHAHHLYAILVHGVDDNSEKRSWPAFIKIKFPNKECTAYVDEGIDLLSRFPDLRAEYVPSASAISRLRRRRIRKQGEVA